MNPTPDRNVVEAQRWLDQAQADLAAARDAMKDEHFEWACFQSQQAAEKALKAYLFRRGEDELIGHSTKRLAERCVQYEQVFAAHVEACAALDKLYVPTRYPNGLPEGSPHEFYSHRDAEQAIGQAAGVLQLVKAHVGVKK